MALNTALGILFLFPQILPHELAHALAARLVGWRVFKIAVGHGRNLYRFRCGKILFEINAIPTIGFTHVGSASARFYRLKKFLFVLAGPLSHAVLLAAIFFLVPLSQFLVPLPGTKLLPWLALVGSCILLLVGNLIPHRIQRLEGSVLMPIDSDGLGLLTAFFLSSAHIRERLAGYFLLEGFLSHQQGDDAAAKQWLERGRELFPEDSGLRSLLALVLLFLKDFHAARSHWLSLLEQEPPPAQRTGIVNNLAWTNMVIGGKELLAEADWLSQEVIRKQPENPTYQGTRGCVLIELGQVDEGLPLVRRAFENYHEPRLKALSACHIALGECQRGNRVEAQHQRDLAHQLDPRCFLLGRVDKALATVAACR